MNIDIVIPWVDGSDENWLAEKRMYDSNLPVDDSNMDMRFRDWGLLRYVFRGIEKHMPWINKIHFLTYGHTPNWLNVNHPKLSIVRHAEFFATPQDLPTYSSHAIEANIIGIPNLSEKFIYFNDDMLVLKKTNVDRYFVENKPVDFLLQSVPRRGSIYRKYRSNNAFSWAMENGVRCVNRHWNKKKLIRARKELFVSKNYRLKDRLKNTMFNCYVHYTHFETYHHPQPYLRSTIEEVVEKCREIVRSTSRSRFRNKDDMSQYLYRYWQLASGNFYPKKHNDHKHYKVTGERVIDRCISEIDKYTFVCLNDALPDTTSNENFECITNAIQKRLEQMMPNVSSYEK